MMKSKPTTSTSIAFEFIGHPYSIGTIKLCGSQLAPIDSYTMDLKCLALELIFSIFTIGVVTCFNYFVLVYADNVILIFK